MVDHLLRRLKSIADLEHEDEIALRSLCEGARHVSAHSVLLEEGARADSLLFLLDGWAFSYKTLRTGKRQILGVLIPGDTCGSEVFALESLDFGVALVTGGTVAMVPEQTYSRIRQDHPQLAFALVRSAAVNEVILRQSLVNLACKDAYARVAHLFCEIWERLRIVAAAEGPEYEFPVSQGQIANMLGLTPVHINRTLRRLREDGLTTFKGGVLTVHNIDSLRQLAGFDPSYLRLGRTAAAEHQLRNLSGARAAPVPAPLNFSAQIGSLRASLGSEW
ncbi:Crp/Fnr family transcriptional regulator [Novosphingobium sp. 9U]|uniref:Crp/Fnr family transcriptional regulator n=1 Tax=Novosphingobium sp. 9U TaxID=2653158 RepID=UPI0012F27368|nr:Crp/Fnr family transcriptional regulator [Novosphingobium sp. 9U]VWX49396.1 Crp/Fnr family transcriptional regulator [Novosphingobium sp. 9U]